MNFPTLYTLKEAARALHTTPRWLTDQIAAKRLRGVRIGRKIYVTEADLAEMIEACRVGARGHGSTSATGADVSPHGSSETERMRSAQAAALMSADALKKGLPPTSPANTPRPPARLRSTGSASRTS